jgi:ABC-type sugar transport system ATPase subunit
MAEPPRDGLVLHMCGISLSFGAVQALKDAEFELRRNEVMALVGENGAGKSSLVKILAGIHKPDRGTIELAGQPYTDMVGVRGPVAVVQQELSLIPTMSAAENVFLGHPNRSRWQSHRQLVRESRPFLAQAGLSDLDPATPAGSLRAAERQLVEVARLVAREAQVLIFDEPTAALADNEIERVKAVVRDLSASGRGIIYVTHRLDEVFELSDRVTVFRNGRSQAPVETASLDTAGLIERMLGRRLSDMFPPRSAGFGEEVLEVDELLTDGLREPVSLTVRGGEVLGLAGQMGSGTTPFLQALAGARRLDGGAVLVAGRKLASRRPRDAIQAGIAYCSGDRKHDGLFMVRTIQENLSAPALGRLAHGGWLSRGRERKVATELAHLFQVDTRRLSHLAGTLSGGNQQKVALGKWIGAQPTVLLVEEPTRGVDVGARAEIYAHLRKLADEGLAVVFASSDITEVLGLADTVATFYRGRLISRQPVDRTDAAAVLRDVTHPETTQAAA